LAAFALLAGTAFAQDGSWSVSGGGEISTLFNFINFHSYTLDGSRYQVGNGVDGTVGAAPYFNYGHYGNIAGKLNLGYATDSGLRVEAALVMGGDHYLGIGAAGDFYEFYASANIMDWLNGTYSAGRLWGTLSLWDGQIKLTTAVNSADTNYFGGNDIIGSTFDDNSIFLAAVGKGEYYGSRLLGVGWGFMSVDHHAYLALEANLEAIDGLSFGFLVPGLFASSVSGGWGTGAAIPGGYDASGAWAGYGYHVHMGNSGGRYYYIPDVFKGTRIGVSYGAGDLGIAFQFDLGSMGAYLSADYKINDNLSAGLNFEGKFYSADYKLKSSFSGAGTATWRNTRTFDSLISSGATAEEAAAVSDYDVATGKYIAFAIGLNFNSGALGIGFNAGYYRNMAGTRVARGAVVDGVQTYETVGPRGYKGIIGAVISPSFKVNDTHLALSVDIGVLYDLAKEGNGTYQTAMSSLTGNDPYVGQLTFSIIPALWYNVMGTGSGAKAYYYPVATGIGVRYRFERTGALQTLNALDICFKWGF
jgi:hypothetical protein